MARGPGKDDDEDETRTHIVVALGSNMGDRLANLRFGLNAGRCPNDTFYFLLCGGGKFFLSRGCSCLPRRFRRKDALFLFSTAPCACGGDDNNNDD